MLFHYEPESGYFGDPVPFYWNGEYHVFYLKGQTDVFRRVKFTPYHHLVSTDLANWRELPVALPCGANDESDMSLGTGTVIERDGTFHLFYCGRVFIGDTRMPEWRVLRETVCHATSTDLVHWDKDPHNPIILPDEKLYERTDFRDPFPFWNPEAGEYWMVVSSQDARSGIARHGALALAVSPDLASWELRPPLWSPESIQGTPECPDIFEMAGKWYCLYSVESRTHYRIADSPSGPWCAPEWDCFDDGATYAGKTIFDGKRRLLITWIATREPRTDDGHIDWGGAMAIPRELVPGRDGTLSLRCPAELAPVGAPLSFTPRTGRWLGGRGERADGAAYATSSAPKDALLRSRISLAPGTRSAGIVFRATHDLSRCYALRIQPARHRAVLQRWPCRSESQFIAECPIIATHGEPIEVKLFLDESVFEAFLEDRAVMGCRQYDFDAEDVGLFVEHGSASFEGVSLATLPV